MITVVPGGRTGERISDGLAVAVLVVIAIIAILTFEDYGLGWDDYTHAEYGGLLLHLYSSGFRDQRALSFVNLYAYGGGFDMLAAMLAKVLPFDLWSTRRLAGVAVGLVGLGVTWRTARHVGGALAGLIALLLLATCPLYYGHMFINPKDAPFAVAMAVFLLGLVRVFKEYPQPSAATVAIAGVGLGLAIGTRILGGLFVVAALLTLVFVLVADYRALKSPLPRQRVATFVLALLPAAILAYAVMALVWPWGVVDPLNPFRAFIYFSHFFEKPWKEMFAGTLVSVPDMPRAYLPQLLALKLPEIFVLLAGGGLAGAIMAATRRAVPPPQRAALLVVALAALVPVVVTVLTRPAMYNGIRHFVFVLPPLAVLGGWAGAIALDWVRQRSQRAFALASLAAVVAFALPAIDMKRLHPYQYTHFNRLAGGINVAQDSYMLDYWGLAFKQASAELRSKLTERNEHPNARRRWRIAVCGPQRAAQIELGPDFVVGWDPKDAEWAMTLGEFYCSELNAPIVVEVKRDGVVFARVYDIRGKSISSLLAVPAP
jgi:hypothetical protein